MSRAKRNDEITMVVMTSTREDFFVRGKAIAKALDEGKPIPKQRIISFEDTNDLIKFLTDCKLNLVKMLRQKPDSISHLAKRLKRSRAAVNRDVQLLESVGIIQSEYVVNPGHGKSRIVHIVDSRPIKLQVQTII